MSVAVHLANVYVGKVSEDTSMERMINTKTKREVRDKTAEYSLKMNSS